MSTRGHNDPITPPDAFLEYMRENYVLVGDDLIYSLKAEKYIGTKSNGCPVHDGYKRVKVNIAAGEKFFKYHHVTFFLFYNRWPRLQVDHKNGRKSDARPVNLEEVTDAENQKRLQQKLRHRRVMRTLPKNGAANEKKVDAMRGVLVRLAMNEKQAKAAFVRQLKPAITAMKREVSNAKYVRGNVPALSTLSVANGAVAVKWSRFEHKACLRFHAGDYAISVPMPQCVATKTRDGATTHGALSILDALNDLVRRAG